MKRLSAALVFLLIASAMMGFELKVEKFKLSNGLEVLLVPNPYSTVMSFQVWVKTGSRNERPGITGITHMLEHMMFKGSRKYGPQEHAKIVQEHGGELNAFTNFDRTVFFDNLSPRYLELAADLESDRFKYLKLDEKEFLSERNVVLEERLMRTENSPYGKALEELFALAYYAHPYHWPVIGWRSDIEHYTIEKVREYFKTHYNPSNVFIVISGNINVDEAKKVVEKYFGDWKAGPKIEEVVTKEPPQEGERRTTIEMNVRVPFIFAAYHIPEYKHPDIPVLEVIEKILSGGESSRIYRELVYNKKLALYAGGGTFALHDPGIFFVYALANFGADISKVEQELFKVVENLENVSEEEVEKARNQLRADFIKGMERAYFVGLQVGESYHNTGDPLFFVKKLERYSKITKKDVVEVAKKYFKKTNRTVVVIVPKGGSK